MSNISLDLLKQNELTQAETLLRLAFGIFLKLPNPLEFGNGAQYKFRWYNYSSFGMAAKLDHQLVGYVILSKWGSFGGLGPLVTHPDYWDQGIGSQLMEVALEKFAQWQVTQMGLCTHANSPKHLYFYGKFGYKPRFLIALFAKNIHFAPKLLQAERYSQLSPRQQIESLQATYNLTDSIYEGLDFNSEIEVVNKYSLGDTLLLWDTSKLRAFAICHYGLTSEAQNNTCYLKFAVAQSAQALEKLLAECENFTATMKLNSLVAGVDTVCEDAYQRMLRRKYKIQSLMLSMAKPNQLAYSRPDTYILDDRR